MAKAGLGLGRVASVELKGGVDVSFRQGDGTSPRPTRQVAAAWEGIREGVGAGAVEAMILVCMGERYDMVATSTREDEKIADGSHPLLISPSIGGENVAVFIGMTWWGAECGMGSSFESLRACE